jgi:hypothetical protein
LVKAGALPEAGITNDLLNTALGIGLSPTEAQATIRSAFNAANPRVLRGRR